MLSNGSREEVPAELARTVCWSDFTQCLKEGSGVGAPNAKQPHSVRQLPRSLRKQPQGAPGLRCLVWRPTSRETREQPELLLWPLKSMMNLLGTGRSTRQPTELPPLGSPASTRCMQLIPGFHKRVWRKEWQQIPCRETSFQAQTERGKGGGGMEGKKKKRERKKPSEQQWEESLEEERPRRGRQFRRGGRGASSSPGR